MTILLLGYLQKLFYNTTWILRTYDTELNDANFHGCNQEFPLTKLPFGHIVVQISFISTIESKFRKSENTQMMK